MDLRQMEYVLALAEHRSFTKAAKALYISQPSLSSYISKAEEELGVMLFDRSTLPFTLTYAGEVYVKNAEKILASCESLKKQLSDISARKVGRIRVGLPNERAAYMLPLLLPEYKKIYPDVSVQVTTLSSTQLLEMLLSSKLDMVITPESVSHKDTRQEEICTEELVLVGNRDIVKEEYLLNGTDQAVAIKHLQQIPLITLSPNHGIRVFVDRLFETYGIRPNIVMETTGNISAYRLATAGLGAAIVPRMTVELIKEATETPVYSLGAAGVRWKIMVTQRKEAYIGRLEEDFIETARRTFAL